MKETQEILLKMGFENPNTNVWRSEWFGVFLLAKTATPEELARFIYDRGVRVQSDNSNWIQFTGNEVLFGDYSLNNCLCKFDNGMIIRYNDQHPMAILTHFKL